MDILAIKNLQKSFGEKKVLCGVDLCVPTHSVFGFVGRNGSGKTTTMKAVLGLLQPDEGEIFVCGEKVRFGQTPTNKYIGYLPDVPEFYSFMSAREYLKLCGESLLIPQEKIKQKSEELLDLVGLSQEKGKIKGYSRGMKQRLGIAQALIGEPALLICDEPTSALDPIGRKEILDILQSVREKTTVLFSSHILSDVERICTNVALLNEGKIAMQGTVEELKNMQSGNGFIVETVEKSQMQSLLSAFEGECLLQEEKLLFSCEEERFYQVLDFMKEQKISIRKIEKKESSLETLFLEVVKK